MSDKTKQPEQVEIPELHDHLVIEIDGEPKKIFMSYGLLTHLAEHVGNPEVLAVSGINPTLLRQLAVITLVDRDEVGEVLLRSDNEITKMFDTLTPNDGKALIAWIQSHLVDFFMTGLQQTNNLVERVNLEVDRKKLQSALESGSLGSQ